MKSCVWCGYLIEEDDGDDCVAHGSGYYHCGCFEEFCDYEMELDKED